MIVILYSIQLNRKPGLKNVEFIRQSFPAWIAGIQSPWMGLSLPSMALDTRFPAGMTNLRII